MNCLEARREFPGFWRRSLAEEQRGALLAHLLGCDSCDHSFRVFALTAPVLHGAPPSPRVQRLAVAPNLPAPSAANPLVWVNAERRRMFAAAFVMGAAAAIALYFSAHWCAPCRVFTPKLVEFYNRIAPQHPEFEIVLVSYDKSPFGLETSMRDAQVPWPAINFAKLPGKEALKKYAGESIPCLVVLDASGKVIFDTYEGKTYRGPERVLTDLDAFFAKPSAPAVAATR